MEASITTAYVWALVIMAVSLGIATLGSQMVVAKPNNPGTTACRVWFWCACAFCLVVGFLINYSIASGIEVPSDHSKYLMHTAIAVGSGTVGYIIIGFIISRAFPNSKVGLWF